MYAKIKDGKIEIYDSFKFKESIKLIENRFFDGDKKCWVIPNTQDNKLNLLALGCKVPEEVEMFEAETVEPAVAVRNIPVKANLYAHQIRAFNKAIKSLKEVSNGYFYQMEQGTGKTLCTIGVLGALYQDKDVNRVLIVAPKSIVFVWETELQKFADFKYDIVLLNKGTAKNIELLDKLRARKNDLQIVVVGYESAWRLELQLRKFVPDMIICDESTKIKNHTAKCSKSIHKISANTKYKLALSGTPITNNPIDLFSQYKFLDNSIFGSNFYQFKGHYVIMGGFENREIIGYNNLNELVKKAHSISYRIKLRDCVDMPDTIDEIRYVELSAAAQKTYKQIAKESYAELTQGQCTTTNVLTKLLRLSQITGGYLSVEDDDAVKNVVQIDKSKLEALQEIIENSIETNEKVVVFLRFTAEIESVCAMLEKMKIQYALIHGATKNRGEQVERFQNDNDCMVFVAQLQCCSMGLTLTAAHIAVYYSLDYNFANYEQSKSRIFRIGQHNKCVYYHLIAKNTVDEQIMSALKSKGDIATMIIDNPKILK